MNILRPRDKLGLFVRGFRAGWHEPVAHWIAPVMIVSAGLTTLALIGLALR